MLDTYYGSFRTRTFAQIFPNLQAFLDCKTQTELEIDVNDEALKNLFYLLYAAYGNSNSAFSDENQFKYAIFSTIFMYGPTWQKRLEVQKALRGLTEDDLARGGTAVYNSAYNPNTAPTTDELAGLPYINQQNKTLYTKSKVEGYSVLLALLDTDVTKEFINKFKTHFLAVVASDTPLLYRTQED